MRYDGFTCGGDDGGNRVLLLTVVVVVPRHPYGSPYRHICHIICGHGCAIFDLRPQREGAVGLAHFVELLSLLLSRVVIGPSSSISERRVGGRSRVGTHGNMRCRPRSLRLGPVRRRASEEGG